MNLQIILPIVFISLIGAILIVAYYFSQKQVVKRKLKKAAGRRLSEYMTGEIAKVVGEVEFVGEPLTAPLSGRKCAWYYVLVEQQQSSGKSSHWEKLIEEEVSGNFVIRDGRQRAYIQSPRVKSYLVEDRQYNSGFRNDPPETLENYLQAHNIQSVGFLGINKTLRYKEGVLEEGECIAVVGQGEWKTAGQLQLPDSFNRVLAITAPEKEYVYLSDDPDTVETGYENVI